MSALFLPNVKRSKNIRVNWFDFKKKNPRCWNRTGDILISANYIYSQTLYHWAKSGADNSKIRCYLTKVQSKFEYTCKMFICFVFDCWNQFQDLTFRLIETISKLFNAPILFLDFKLIVRSWCSKIRVSKLIHLFVQIEVFSI